MQNLVTINRSGTNNIFDDCALQVVEPGSNFPTIRSEIKGVILVADYIGKKLGVRWEEFDLNKSSIENYSLFEEFKFKSSSSACLLGKEARQTNLSMVQSYPRGGNFSKDSISGVQQGDNIAVIRGAFSNVSPLGSDDMEHDGVGEEDGPMVILGEA